MEKWKTRKSEKLIDNHWVKVRRDAVELPNGQSIDDFYAVTINDAAAIVALDDKVNTEELDVIVIPLSEAVEMVMKNEVCCNSSAHGILRVARMLGV